METGGHSLSAVHVAPRPSPPGPMWKEFKAFLLKENVLALAIAVVVGGALNKLVTALVDDWIMPIIAAVTPGGDWQKAVFPQTGPVQFKWGDFASALLNFFIIGLVAWRISKIFIKPPAPAAAAPTKTCPYCMMIVDVAATRCAHCTSELK
jgi:large conductance mechanosensitive channel